MSHIDTIISYFAWLIAILSPFTAIPYYLLLKEQLKFYTYKKDALIVGATVLIILSACLFVWKYVFDMFWLEMMYFRIAGNLIVIYISFFMTIGKDFVDHESDGQHSLDKVWSNALIIPISMPLLSGPGSIAYVLNLIHDDMSNLLYIWIAIAAWSVVVYLSIRYSVYIRKTLWDIGIKLFSRFMGLILLGIAIQTLVENMKLAWLF